MKDSLPTTGNHAAQKPLTCEHCALPIPPADLVVDQINDTQRNFCCHGCRGAYRIITDSGLGRFYNQRDWHEPGLPEGAFANPYDDASLAKHVRYDGDRAEFTFLLEGLRCATCVWLNEKVLNGLDGVIESRINYGTHRARVRFEPEKTSPEAIFAAIARLGYRPRPFTRDALHETREMERRNLLIRFGTAFFLSMQLMGYSLALYAGYFQGIDPDTRQLLQWFAALVTTPVVLYSGWPFLAGAWRSLRNRAANMDLLIAIGVLAAYGSSIHALLTGGEVYFDTAAMIITLILAGRLFENAARGRAATGVDRLLHLAPETSMLIGDDGSTTPVESASLIPGDLIRVRAGERFPTDGSIAVGSTEVDVSAATGEPMPQPMHEGDCLLAGMSNLLAPVTVRVTRPAADSFVARMARLVEDAQARRAPIQRTADRIAAWFVPLVVLLAGGTWLTWRALPTGDQQPLLIAIAVLVIACPCALGLATPTAVLVASGSAAASGILFRGGDVLEAAARLDWIGFDKTGTLTTGRPRVMAIQPATGSESELLAMALRLEGESNHPLAEGVRAEAAARGLAARPLPGVRTLPGRGLEAEQQGILLLAGNRAHLEEQGVALPDQPPVRDTEVHLAEGGVYRGRILFSDQLRPLAPELIASCRKLGIRTVLLTGDSPAAGAALAELLGMDESHGGLTPAEKATLVEQARARGQRVMMVGDGINDAPALATADVGCAMRGGTDIALDSSDLVLTRPDFDRLLLALALARRSLRIIRQNLFWAFAYNLCALPLAAAGKLAPIHAAAAMALSSICVVGNSLRLGRQKAGPDLRPQPTAPELQPLRPRL